MIEIKVTGTAGVERMLAAIPGKAARACAVALNQTALAIRKAGQEEMRRVFDKPRTYTLRSIVYDRATKTDLVARVYHAEPERMSEHYLTPQVFGGARKLKGFERGLGLGELVPAMGAKMDAQGNVSTGQIRQMLSVLGRAESSAGYSANMTTRSAKRGPQRDYVLIKRRRGRLIPGVYQRVESAGREIDVKLKKRLGIKGAKAYEMGRSKGKWQSIRRARGLMPVLLQGRTGKPVKPLFDFYGVADQTYTSTFEPKFWATLNQYLQS